ncbi:unnamed protein product [Linum tenue]|nr:unnamed protein product [Linum tenue]
MEGGPWLLGDTYLTVHRWFKGFNPWKTEITTTMVWVQLPELPIEFINKEAVMKIGQWLGKPVRVDRATEIGARGRFARLCVEVDLTQPLLSQYKIEGTTYLIRYEGLDDLCTNCGTYGKSGGKCQCNLAEKAMETEEVRVDEMEKREDPTQGRTYGEWMVVKRRERRPGRGVSRGKEGKGEGSESNRFQAFAGEVHQVRVEEEAVMVDRGEAGKPKDQPTATHPLNEGLSHAEGHAHLVEEEAQMHSSQGKSAKSDAPSQRETMTSKKESVAAKPQGVQTAKGNAGVNPGKKGEGKKQGQRNEGIKNVGLRMDTGGTSTLKKADGAGNRSPSVHK